MLPAFLAFRELYPAARSTSAAPGDRIAGACGNIRRGWSPEDLPIGIQVVVNPYRDHIALAIMPRLEEVPRGWRSPAKNESTRTAHDE